MDCADCHPTPGTDKVNWVIDTARKRTARRMVEMVAAINRANFGGAQKVTCWTCHHGRETPRRRSMLDNWYDAPNAEVDDLVLPDKNEPPVGSGVRQVFAGARRHAESVDDHELGRDRHEPRVRRTGWQRGVHDVRESAESAHDEDQLPGSPERPSSVWAFNGRARGSRRRAPCSSSTRSRAGARRPAFRGATGVPRAAETGLTNWRVGSMRTIGDTSYRVVQGNGARGFLATLYFDLDSGLLARMVRYGSRRSATC